MDLMHYVVAAVVIGAAMALLFALVQALADLAILGLGIVALIVVGKTLGGAPSWGQLLAMSALWGAVAGLVAIPILPFSSVVKGPKAP